DYVYLAPEHLGEPYYIGRVMEFCTSPKRKGLQARIAWFNRPKDVINRKSYDPCLLVATMHSDLNPVSSIRGKCVVTHKYYIRKEDMDHYRAQEDHFYYSQLYDRYIQRVYDLVPCETVHNVPMDIQEALRHRYQFIVVEQGKAADLTVARRTCCVCQAWCASATSVKCAACQKNYHMACLNPPLTRKPSKGFAWQCAFCSRKELMEEQAVHEGSLSAENHHSRIDSANSKSTQRSTIRQTRNAARLQNSLKPLQLPKNQAAATVEESHDLKKESPKKLAQWDQKKTPPMRTTHMWPFRYFGVNTNISDILDVDDRIYPRARSRLGAKYQASVPEWHEGHRLSASPVAESSQGQNESPGRSGTGRNRSKRVDKRGRPVNKKKSGTPGVSAVSFGEKEQSPSNEPYYPIRGTDETVTPIFSRPHQLSENELDNYMEKIKSMDNLPLPFYSSDLQDHALIELEKSHYDTQAALQNMSKLTASDFRFLVEWSPEEVAAFEQSIQERGHDLHSVKPRVPTKTMADIVRYFYIWKKTDRYEPVYSEWTRIYRPTKKFKKHANVAKESPEEDSDSDVDSEEESDPTIVPPSTYNKRSYQCANCMVTESPLWRRPPSDTDRKRKVFRTVLCNECGIYWLKYGKMKPVSEAAMAARSKGRQSKTTADEEPVETCEASEGSTLVRISMKRKKLADAPNAKSVSKKLKDEKRNNVLHFASSPCAVCRQETPHEKVFVCYDCGMSVHDDCYGITTSNKEGWICDVCHNKKAPSASYQYECVLCYESSKLPHQALKTTSGYNWAHVTCSAFIPEVKYVHSATLQPIEYIGAIAKSRWLEQCRLCNESRGACVICADCEKPVHVECAIQHQFKVAFEIQPIGTDDSAITIPSGLFANDSPAGIMVPEVWCPEHDISHRHIVELNARTTDTGESSIRAYAKRYKGIESGTTPAMRRYRAIQQPAHPQGCRDAALYQTDHTSVHSANEDSIRIPSARQSALDAMPSHSAAPTPTTNITTKAAPSSRSSTSSSPISTFSTSSSDSTNFVCTECPVTASPIWWNADDHSKVSGKKLCHRCWWRRHHPEQPAQHF
ncbi:uncharacterized protein BYT42DRAFT_492613, partial [Radiomyces spectabilis]|uniref:uncharacterized protein n=1 Tax=Radiomyces spectabilis TaxID=64574 RepID=UPI00221F3F9C